MVIDTSALAAILWDEPERDRFVALIGAAPRRLISAATWVEAGIVIEGDGGEEAGRDLDTFLYNASVEIVPVDAQQARAARAAYSRYGKGHHRARLNLGDCFSYALAKLTGEPLLYKGADFGLTDITSAAGPESA
jgi:ribonuclease VapC